MDADDLLRVVDVERPSAYSLDIYWVWTDGFGLIGTNLSLGRRTVLCKCSLNRKL